MLIMVKSKTIANGHSRAQPTTQELSDKTIHVAYALCRSSQQASVKQLKQAASLLKAAGGVQWVEEGGQAADNALIPKQAMISIHPSLHVAAKSHTGALKKLSSIYLHGEFLPSFE